MDAIDRDTAPELYNLNGRPALRAVQTIPVLIGIVTVLAFLPVLGNDFVLWDDDKLLLDNPAFRGLGLTQLRWMFTAFFMGHYMPLTWMTYGLDYVLWGMNPVGYHLSSLVLHAGNAVVFYFVARRLLGGNTLGAALAALLFAVHPLRVESVAWVTERRDVLSGLGYLLAVLAYLRACEQQEGRERWRWYWASVGAFALSLGRGRRAFQARTPPPPRRLRSAPGFGCCPGPLGKSAAVTREPTLRLGKSAYLALAWQS